MSVAHLPNSSDPNTTIFAPAATQDPLLHQRVSQHTGDEDPSLNRAPSRSGARPEIISASESVIGALVPALQIVRRCREIASGEPVSRRIRAQRVKLT